MSNQTQNILLVDDDPLIITTIGHVLGELGQVRFARSGLEALAALRQSPLPDLLLLDIELPGMSGLEVCSIIKASPKLHEIPIIFLSGHTDPDQEVKCLQLGAADFITKPPRPAQLTARACTQLRMQKINKALREAAATDPLTELANRRRFDETLQREWLRSMRSGAPISLLMIDVDFFKAYNDSFGHLEGDRCLRSVAQALSRVVHRPADVLARYGGEEFAVLLPDTPGRGGCAVAQYALDQVRSTELPHTASALNGRVTVSIGVSAVELFDRTYQASVRYSSLSVPRFAALDLIAAADQALYSAKAGGRGHARYLSLDNRGSPDRAIDLRASAACVPHPEATDKPAASES